jgi:hypothetical protein
MSSTSSVIAIAKTPSLKASMRLVSHRFMGADFGSRPGYPSGMARTHHFRMMAPPQGPVRVRA